MSGWDFSNQNLIGSQFAYSILSNASFEGAKLSGISFSYNDLSSANFTGANLSGVYFYGAILKDAVFTNAIVNNAVFDRTIENGFTSDMLYSTKSYIDRDLSGITLNDNELISWNFGSQNLENASFSSSDLKDANFDGANIKGASFLGAYNFTSEQLYSTESYRDRDLRGVQLALLDLSNWNLKSQNLENADFSYAYLENTDFTGANIKGAKFDGAQYFTDAQLYSTLSYQDKDLSGINLSENDLTGWNLSGQNLTNADFSANKALGVSDIFYTTLIDTQFNDAIITGANFIGTVNGGFTKEQLYSTASYKNGNLTGIKLSENDLTGWDFSSQNLSNASFGYERENVYYGVNLEFNAATLKDANFEDAIVKNVNFGGTVANGFTKEQLYSTASYKNGNLEGIKLSENDLTGWDFSSQNLSNASFGYERFNEYESNPKFNAATLRDANFENAIVKNVNFSGTVANGFTKEQLYSTRSYKDKELGAIDMTRNDLSGWDFTGQNLERADFSESNLDGATFEKANLMNARFEETTGEVNFVGADLRGVKFLDVDMIWTTGPNTIGNDNGEIDLLLVDKVSGDVSIRKYTPVVSGGEMISAKVMADGYVSENASLILEEGAVLEVIESSVLSVFSNLTFNIGNDGAGKLIIENGSVLDIADSGSITIDLAEDMIAGDFMFEIINFDEYSSIFSLEQLEKNKNLFLTQGGESFDGEWSYDITADSFIINVSVPEPSTYAAIFGVIALVFAAYRRR